MRTELKKFRVGEHLTQSEMAEKIGVSRVTYQLVENGKRSGNHTFWKNLKFVFEVPDEEMWKLQEVESCEGNSEK